jgi:uncharacterized membrane protein
METFPLPTSITPNHLSILFRFSMWWRIAYGSVRLVVGVALLQYIGTPISDLLLSVMQHEVTQDVTDALFQFFYHLIEDHSFTVTYFIALYLIFWGLVDIVLSLCLLWHKLWAFSTTMVLIALFILYSVYRFTHTHSLILLSIIFIDIVILYLISIEYKKLRSSI